MNNWRVAIFSTNHSCSLYGCFRCTVWSSIVEGQPAGFMDQNSSIRNLQTNFCRLRWASDHQGPAHGRRTGRAASQRFTEWTWELFFLWPSYDEEFFIFNSSYYMPEWNKLQHFMLLMNKSPSPGAAGEAAGWCSEYGWRWRYRESSKQEGCGPDHILGAGPVGRLWQPGRAASGDPGAGGMLIFSHAFPSFT